jgi:hypothetical protein
VAYFKEFFLCIQKGIVSLCVPWTVGVAVWLHWGKLCTSLRGVANLTPKTVHSWDISCPYSLNGTLGTAPESFLRFWKRNIYKIPSHYCQSVDRVLNSQPSEDKAITLVPRPVSFFFESLRVLQLVKLFHPIRVFRHKFCTFMYAIEDFAQNI